MKFLAAPTQRISTFFITLFVVGTLTLAGCSASTISGPDLAPTEDAAVQEAPAPSDRSAPHNEEEASKGGGGGKAHAGHNNG